METPYGQMHAARACHVKISVDWRSGLLLLEFMVLNLEIRANVVASSTTKHTINYRSHLFRGFLYFLSRTLAIQELRTYNNHGCGSQL